MSTNESTNSSPDVENQRPQLNHDLRDMFSHLRQTQGPEEEDTGVRIITLAGTNTGATLKSDLKSDPRKRQNHQSHGIKLDSLKEDDDEGESEDLGTLVNSNFQAVNNSIMVSGSFSSNDPGVRVEIYGDGDEPRRSKLQSSPEEGESNAKGNGRRYQPIVGAFK